MDTKTYVYDGGLVFEGHNAPITMTNPSDVWAKLSAINVNEHTEDKGGFTYLAWTWAWAAVKRHYPTAKYCLLEDKVYADGSMEVRCEVTIEGLTHPMWLPVTDHRNKAIQNPDAFAVNTARMRCLTKCLAMFGLGHYIYAGESLPAAPPLSDEVRDNLLNLMAKKDAVAFAHLYRAQTEEHLEQFFDGFGQGHKTKQKQVVRDLLAEYRTMVEQYSCELVNASANDDAGAVLELVNELDSITKKDVWAILNDAEQVAIRELLKEANR